MPSVNAATVFAKQVFNIVTTAGYKFDERTTHYIELLGNHQLCMHWRDIKSQTGVAIHDLYQTNPAQAVDMLIAITSACEHEAHGAFAELLPFLDGRGLVAYACSNAPSHDARYALALCLLFLADQSGAMPYIAKSVENLVGVVVSSHAAIPKRHHIIATALFGPIWTALYAEGHLSGEDLFRFILGDRPPFTDAPGQAVADVELANDLAP